MSLLKPFIIYLFKGYSLQSHVIAFHHVTRDFDCGIMCLQNKECLSYNYKPMNNNHNECQLNDASKVSCPGCLTVEPGVIYYDVVMVSYINQSNKSAQGKQREFRINLGLWETAHLPLLEANIITYFLLRAKCWLRDG